MRLLICSILILGLLGNVRGQTEKQLFKEAKKAFEFDRYRKASQLYTKLVELAPENPKYLYHFGICNLMSFDYEHGLDHIVHALELDPNVDQYSDYWLGRAHHLNYHFEEAVRHYKQFMNGLKEKDSRRAELEKLILEAEYGAQICAAPKAYKVQNIGSSINTLYSEHSPVVSQDGNMIIFTSRRYYEMDEGINAEDRIGIDGEYYERIFVTFKNDEGVWSEPQPIIGLEDLEDQHQATVDLYDNDSKLLIYRNQYAGDIFVSNRINDTTWTEPERIKNVNSIHREVDAYVTFDGQRMFMSSSSDNTEHDLDLYYCEKMEDGLWSAPISLGDVINTDYEENSPFLSKDGLTLYFSSKGHTTIGGYDVFKSVFDTVSQTWGVPQNVGYPINTPGDDIYFYFSDKNAWSGFFSSYRAGGNGEKDLYEVTFVPNVHIKGQVVDKLSGELMTNLEVNFISEQRSHHNGIAGYNTPVVTSSNIDADNFQYEVNVLSDSRYNVLVMDGADTLYNAPYTVPELQEGDDLYYTYNIEIDPFPEAEVPIVVTRPTIEEKQPEEKVDTSALLAVKEDESVLTDDHELKLIAEEDELKPILDDSEQKSFPEDNTYDTYVTRIEPTESYSAPPLEEFVFVDNYDTQKDIEAEYSEAMEYFRLEKEEIKEGCRVVLRNVYFDFNKSTLKKDSYDELNNLLCLLTTNESISMEIGGHTDNVGKSGYNLILSQKRAMSIVQYLIQGGVDKDRLIAKGYGETVPLASNDDEEEGRILNRRTEFIIISVDDVTMATNN